MNIQHYFDFDPTCAYSPEQLAAVGAPDNEPDDFKDFWKKTCSEACDFSSEIRLRQLWSPGREVEVYEVRYKSFGGVAVGAWLTRPRKSRGGIIQCHGYGGVHSPVFHENFTVLAPCVRGFNLSNSSEFPWRSSEHVLFGIQSKESYIIRACVADIIRATSVLLELFPDVEHNLNFRGGSFGGGIGALALPWDKRFKAAYLDVPTFGNHPLRLKFKSNGSGEPVRNYAMTHPEVIDVLKYFDAATAAAYIRIPCICSPALFDPTVIPPGQFAVNNSIPKSCRQTFILPAGHFQIRENEPVRTLIDEAVRELFLSPPRPTP